MFGLHMKLSKHRLLLAKEEKLSPTFSPQNLNDLSDVPYIELEHKTPDSLIFSPDWTMLLICPHILPLPIPS